MSPKSKKVHNIKTVKKVKVHNINLENCKRWLAKCFDDISSH